MQKLQEFVKYNYHKLVTQYDDVLWRQSLRFREELRGIGRGLANAVLTLVLASGLLLLHLAVLLYSVEASAGNVGRHGLHRLN